MQQLATVKPHDKIRGFWKVEHGPRRHPRIFQSERRAQEIADKLNNLLAKMNGSDDS